MADSSGNESLLAHNCVDKFTHLMPNVVQSINHVMEESSSDERRTSDAPTETRSLSSAKLSPRVKSTMYPPLIHAPISVTGTSTNGGHTIETLSDEENDEVAELTGKNWTPNGDRYIISRTVKTTPRKDLKNSRTLFHNISAITHITPNGSSSFKTSTPKSQDFRDKKEHTLNGSIFFQPDFTQARDETVENLASQLRGMITIIDMGIDLRRQKLDHLEEIRKAKAAAKEKELQRKELMLKSQLNENDRKVLDRKAQKKLDDDRKKLEGEVVDKLNKDITELRRKNVEQGTQLASYRSQINTDRKKLDELTKNYEAEKNKSKKMTDLAGNLATKLRAKEEADRRLAADQRAKISQTAAKGRNVGQRSQSSFSFGGSSSGGSSATPSPSLPFVIPEMASAKDDARVETNSTGFIGQPSTSLTKNVRWQDPLSSAFSSTSNVSDEVFDDDGELLELIPADMKELTENAKETDEYFMKYFCNRSFIRWFKMKACGCERLLYESDNFRYRCTKNVVVDVSFLSQNGQIIITFEDIKIVTFPNQQLEIYRGEKDRTVFTPEGDRYDRIFYSKGYVDEILDSAGRRRVFPDKQVENMDENEEKQAERDDNDYVTRTGKRDFVYHPLFELGRSGEEGFDGVFQLHVYYPSTEKKKRLQIKVCPTHGVIHAQHCDTNAEGKLEKVLCTALKRCEHIKKR